MALVGSLSCDPRNVRSFLKSYFHKGRVNAKLNIL